MAKESKAKGQSSASSETPKPTAVSIVARLANRFFKSAEQVITDFPYEHRQELIEHFVSMLGYMEQHSNSDNEQERDKIWSEYKEKEHLLLSKHGRRLMRYEAHRFNLYFDVDYAVMEFEVIPLETYYEKLEEIKEDQLGSKGMSSFLQLVRNGIGGLKRAHLLSREPEVPSGEQIGSPAPAAPQKETERSDREAYKARAVLGIYFELLARRIEGRVTHDVSAVSRYAHMHMAL